MLKVDSEEQLSTMLIDAMLELGIEPMERTRKHQASIMARIIWKKHANSTLSTGKHGSTDQDPTTTPDHSITNTMSGFGRKETEHGVHEN